MALFPAQRNGCAMPFPHRLRNKENLLADLGGKAKNILEIKENLQHFCFYNYFFILSFLIVFLYATEISQIYILSGWLPKKPVKLRPVMLSAESLLHFLQTMEALFYPSLPCAL